MVKLFGTFVGCFFVLLLQQCEKSPTQPDDTLFNLRITEIHYNPQGSVGWSEDSLEFIELKNVGTTRIDLGSLDFTDGINYRFATTATLFPDSFFVLASNQTAFTQRYGVKPDAVYKGQLKNSGETITLYDELTETTLLTVTYGDSAAGWSAEADGEGYSLVVTELNPEENSSYSVFWRHSVKIHGSPGSDDVKLPVDELLFDLRLTEIHYHPADVDGFGGDSLEFLELKNVGEHTIKLARAAFTAGIDYAFSDSAELDPGEFIVLASNKLEFLQRYDKRPYDVYSGQLSNSGEDIVLEDVLSGVVVFSITYADGVPWPGSADGDGYSLVPFSTTPVKNQSSPSFWRASFRRNGSPGADDPGVIVVNEVVSNPMVSLDDAIELFNPGTRDVDISGWFLTDHKADPVKFIIPDGTIIGAGDYLVFSENDFATGENAAYPFSLSAHGDDVYIMSDSSGCLGEGYCHGCTFGELEEGMSFGRFITPSGDEVFTSLSALTLGEKNTRNRAGPIVISEIMYHSSDGISDFIEIINIDFKELRLYDPQNPDNTWKIDGLEFSFPANRTIKSGESILIISDSISIDEFRERYALDDTIQVFQFRGKLSDSKQKLLLMKPEPPYTENASQDIPIVPYMLIDEVKYSADKPWPGLDANGNGLSIHKNKTLLYGSDSASWMAASPDPGKVIDQ